MGIECIRVFAEFRVGTLYIFQEMAEPETKRTDNNKDNEVCHNYLEHAILKSIRIVMDAYNI